MLNRILNFDWLKSLDIVRKFNKILVKKPQNLKQEKVEVK